MSNSQGYVLWFTGLSGSGKSTLATYLAPILRKQGCRVEILDGDEVRENLSKGLGFSKEDRDTNIRRIGFVAELLAKNGVVAITAAISPYREIRDEVRQKVTRHGAGFCEVYVHCPIEVLSERDVKGLYKKARAGEIKGELMMIWGRQDPHIPGEGRTLIYNAMTEAGILFSWLEFNGQHAFMRDEGPRYDPELALKCYGLALELFKRKLGSGALPTSHTAPGSVEIRH